MLSDALGFLMISRFPYSSFKSVSFDRRVPFVRMLLVVAVVADRLDPPLAIWVLSVVYALSGPLQHLRHDRYRAARRAKRTMTKTDLH